MPLLVNRVGTAYDKWSASETKPLSTDGTPDHEINLVYGLPDSYERFGAADSAADAIVQGYLYFI